MHHTRRKPCSRTTGPTPTRAKKPHILGQICARPSIGRPWAGWTTCGATATCSVPARRQARTRLSVNAENLLRRDWSAEQVDEQEYETRHRNHSVNDD